MLQYLYNETGLAAQSIVEEVAPVVNKVTKEDIAAAAADRAEAIVDSIAKNNDITQKEYSDIMTACAQVIYSVALGEAAKELAYQELYNASEAEDVHNYLKNYSSVKGALLAHSGPALIGAGGGALVGNYIMKKRAKKLAKKHNLTPGTPEYNDFIRKYKRRGRRRGAVVGALASVVPVYHNVAHPETPVKMSTADRYKSIHMLGRIMTDRNATL